MNCIWALLIACASCACRTPGTALVRHEAQRRAMGTHFRLIFYAPPGPAAPQAAQACWTRLAQLESRMSDYSPASELSRLSESQQWMACSQDLWRVLLAAREMEASSAGAFDITVGPLVKLWRRAMRQDALPPEASLAQALSLVGAEHLELDLPRHRARCRPAGVGLDLGGIAKGDALDQLLLVLHERGIDSALVDGGGDVAVGDPPPGQAGWKVAIENGRGGEQWLTLAHQALASSGARYRYLELDGVRYSHVVDPRTGLGVVGLMQVSVLAAGGALADAAATALSVLGAADGSAWIAGRPDLEACWWDGENPEARPCASSGFPL